jgi:hypothetical protein
MSELNGFSTGKSYNFPLNPGFGDVVTTSGKVGMNISGSLSPINISGIHYEANSVIEESRNLLSFEVSKVFEDNWNKGLDILGEGLILFHKQISGNMRER